MKRKHNSKLFLLLFLSMLSAFGPFVIDLYLPALPAISKHFSASESLAQLTLAASMAGLAIGQLLIGPISDKFGRKTPLTISLIIYTISTISIFFTDSINAFIILRIIEGLSSAGSVVIARAVVSDIYSGHEMTKFFSLMMVINSIAPILSPIGGSLLLKFTDWHGIFIALSVIGIVLFIANFNYRESLPSARRLNTPLLKSYSVYKILLFYPKFMSFVGIQTFALSAIFAYIAASPFILQKYYNLNELTYALCFGANGFALSVAAAIASRIKEQKALNIGVFGLICAAIFVGFALCSRLALIFIMLGFFMQLFFSGFILPTASALAMNCGRKYAGSSSALLGFCPFFMGGIVSPLVGMGDIFISSSVVILSCSIICAILAVVVIKLKFIRHKNEA